MRMGIIRHIWILLPASRETGNNLPLAGMHQKHISAMATTKQINRDLNGHDQHKGEHQIGLAF
jgi:hypothetical protein